MIYLLGTSHIAQESVDKVWKNISLIKPEIVAVELDYARFKGLISGKKGKMKIPISQKMIFVLLQKLQDNLSKETGIMPGQEMLDAVKHAKELDLKVALIDQKINVTVHKLMTSMGFFEKIKFVFSLGLGLIGIGASKFIPSETIDLNKIPEDEFIDYAMEHMKTMFPSIYKVLVSDRNWYMSQNLINISTKFDNVVAVIGAGHVKGIKKLLEKEDLEVTVL